MKLRYGYLGMGVVIGLILLGQFVTSLPDGKLHITFCDVGQGDAAYLRFPDGRDMLIDGGPNSKVIQCLSSVMPFWDRHLDGVVLSHPDQDHFGGLVDVVNRYTVGVLIRSDISNDSESFQTFEKLVRNYHIPVRLVSAQDRMRLGPVVLTVLWPTLDVLSQTNNIRGVSSTDSSHSSNTDLNRNDFSVVLHLRFKRFDAVFPGDADERVETRYTGTVLSPDGIEVLKVPHHGSATGMTDEFISWLSPKISVISVGKNNRYNHPSIVALEKLSAVKSKIFRTDTNGVVTIETDGIHFSYHNERENSDRSPTVETIR